MRILWLTLFWVSCASAADRFDGVRTLIRRQLDGGATPSVAVAVAKDGKIVWEEGFGWADREKRISASEHTPYSLASISKPITATGLMVLVVAGRIDLDRPVNDYLGAAKLRGRAGDAAQATVRRVANHSAGLPLHYHFFYSDEPHRRPPMDETIRRYANLITPPGERFQYSNLGYGVLDYVIARVSGKSYPDFMREEVFAKLGLNRMSVDVAPGLEAHQALRYGAGGPIPFYDFDHPGGSAIYSSAHDLVRFGMFHLKARLPDQKAILPDQTIDDMHRPTVKTGERSGYGIGWASTENAGGYSVVSHTGGMGGVATTLQLVPPEKLAVVVLSNSAQSLPHTVAEEILAVMLPKWRRSRREPPPPPPQFSTPNELAGRWQGQLHTYKAEIPLSIEFLKSGEVRAQLGQQAATQLENVRWRDGAFSARMTGDIGTEDAARRPYSLSLSLRLRGSVLNGGATAMSLPGKRAGNALTQWVELRRDLP
ncbi:MAG: serine hydrolase domain-containing protein [Bryobacteraceae bacterium]